MAGADTGEKTEGPTPQKLKQLRKENTVRRSQDLPSAVSLLVLALALPLLVASLFESFLVVMRSLLTVSGSTTSKEAPGVLAPALWQAVTPVLGPLALVLFSVIVTSVGYSRSKPNLMALKPKFKQTLDPMQGLKRIVSVNSLVELGKGIAKILAVGVVAYFSWTTGVTQLLAGVSSVEGFASSVGGSIKKMVTQVAIAAIVIGVIDAIWQDKRYNKQAKMSKYDVTKEFKQSEGDPHMKQQRRSRAQALSRGAMVAAAAGADVVVVNPTHIAVAIEYNADLPAPRVIAKGSGHVASRIRLVAEEAGVPIKRDVPLARALHSSVEVGQWIPAELYTAAAGLLADVFNERREPRGAGKS